VKRRVPILVKLLGATLAPTAVTFAGFGLLAHLSARRALEEELGRRLESVASAAALAVRGERVDLLGPGDEDSRAWKSARRKLTDVQIASGVKRIYVFDASHTSRADTDAVPIGDRYHALDADQAELERVFAGQAAASVLFTGRDGAHYKSGFAPLRDDDGRVALAVGADGSAEIFAQLAAFRRTLFLVGAVGLGLIGALSIMVARFITRPVTRLERAARAIGAGDLSRPISAESADEIGFLAGTLDEMRRQLAARDQRLQMMLAGIAHEVRNPLGGMELFAGLLRDELKDDPERLAHVAKIERELGHLKSVVTDFLEYARRPRPELRATDAGELLREVGQLLEADAQRAEVAIDLAVEGAPEVACDAAQIRRALLNLGRNALQACPPGARVTLACAAVDGEVRLSVRDTGRGIPAEQLDEIFAPFYTTREQGTGLGLAFVAEIARDHAGAVRVESRPGEGATFTLHLPRRGA
jgi:signal transduction histidine kinase